MRTFKLARRSRMVIFSTNGSAKNNFSSSDCVMASAALSFSENSKGGLGRPYPLGVTATDMRRFPMTFDKYESDQS